MFYYFTIISINALILNIIEYSIHKLSHNPKIKFLYKSHHSHHISYPPKALMRKEYSKNVEDTRLPFIIILVTSYIFFYFILSIKYYILFFSQTTIYFYLANLLHNSYHLENPFLQRYGWFRYLKKLHHIHHIKTHNNLNITVPITDKINNTYSNK